MEFQRYKLSQLITIKNGKDYKHLEEGDVPVFGSGGYMCSVSSYLYDKVSILLPRKGTLSNIQYFNNGKFWTVDTCFYSIINESLCNPYYLYRHLRSLDLSGYDTGASIPSMTQKTYNGIKVMLPSLPAQHRIASILSAYDNLIENNNKRIRLLEQMAENLYKEWFVRFRFPGHDKAEFENGLPKGWRIGRLSEYGRIETGKTPSMLKLEYYGGEYLFIKTPDMHGNMFVRETEETLSEKGNLSQPKKLLPIGSIMVSCIGSGGVVAINAKQGHTNQQINSIILSNTEDLEWLYFTCKALKPMIELFGATGATMTNLSKGKFEKLKVIEPPFNLRKLFHLKTKSMFDEILKFEESNTSLSRQRDLLLPRLMSGKLEVNV